MMVYRRRRSQESSQRRSHERKDNKLLASAEEGGRLIAAPSWGKLSFKAWKKAIEEWADCLAKPQRKAQLLIECMMKEEEQKEHPGLKEMVEMETLEYLGFDKRKECCQCFSKYRYV